MYYDLGLQHTDKASWLALCLAALQDGYAGVASNRTVHVGSLVHLQPPVQENTLDQQELENAMQNSLQLSVGKNSRLEQWSRITVEIEEEGECVHLENPVLRAYDVVAVRTGSTAVLKKVLQSFHKQVDLVSLRLEKPLPDLQGVEESLQEKQLFLEVSYQLLVSDPSQRRNIFQNGLALVDHFQPQALGQVLFSSDVSDVLQLRSPHDLALLAQQMGMTRDQAYHSIGDNPLRLLRRAALRREQPLPLLKGRARRTKAKVEQLLGKQ